MTGVAVDLNLSALNAAGLVSAVQNRHPADRLAEVRSEIRQLEAEEEQLRAYLLEHPQDRTGQEYTAIDYWLAVP